MADDEKPEQKENGVSPDRVKKFMKEHGGQGAVEPTATEKDEDPLSAINLDPEKDDVVRVPLEDPEAFEEPEIEYEETAPEGPFTGTAEEAAEREANKPHDPYARIVPGLGEVRVSEAEVDEFVRAFWHDDFFELTVAVPVGDRDFKVRARSLTNTERELVYNALNRLRDDNPNDMGSLTLEYLQRMSAALQILAVNDKEFKGRVSLPEDTDPFSDMAVKTITEAAEKIPRYVKHQTAWQAIVAGMRIFEAKQAILEDGVGNRTFFENAGTA